MTKILPIRLNEKEFAMLDEILSSENCESENRSEWIRLLIYREWNKRKKLGVPKSQDFATSFRTTYGLTYRQRVYGRGAAVGVIQQRWHNAQQFKLKLSPPPNRTAGGERKSARQHTDAVPVKMLTSKARHLTKGKKCRE